LKRLYIQHIHNILRPIRGIDVIDPQGSAEIIRRAVDGEGHFLGDQNTLALMKTGYLYPKPFDRKSSDEWEAQGRQDIRESARELTQSTLENHYPKHIDEALYTDLRKRFPIKLPHTNELKKRASK